MSPGQSTIDRLLSLGALTVLVLVFSVTANNFLTIRNILTIALQTSSITLMGIGVTFVIIAGGIDLSIGSVVALSGTLAVMAANAGVPVWLSMGLGCTVGVICGLGNGLLVTKLRIPPFIATLSTMMILRGFVLTITNASSSPAPPEFGDLGNRSIFSLERTDEAGNVVTLFPGISYIVLVMIVLALVFHFLLKKTKIGRYTYAVGSNEEASRLSGIKVSKIRITTYIICGTLAALVGVLLASRMITSQPAGGVGYEMNAIAAAVIGGASLLGGAGTIGRTVMGSFVIGVLNAGLTMLGASYFSQQIIVGCVIIAAVAADQIRYRKT